MKSLFFLCSVFAFCFSVGAQDLSKPWTEWSKKDAEKVLNDSSWGQTYVQEAAAPTSSAVVTNTRGGMASGDTRNVESGESKASGPVKYRARFLTAKPVREAFSRMVILSQPTAPADLTSQLQGFIDRDFGDFLVVSFSLEGGNAKGAEMMLSRLTGEMLKDKVFLERKDGKKANFIDYKVPMGDGMGAKIVFSRTLDNKPFLGEGDDFVKFFFQVSDRQKISMKFKVSGMNYAGKLEY